MAKFFVGILITHNSSKNTVFSAKNTTNFLGRGTAPFPDPSPSGEADTPSPHPTPSALDPLHAEILGMPLYRFTSSLFSQSQTKRIYA